MTFTVIPGLKDKLIQLKQTHTKKTVPPLNPLDHVILGNTTHWRTAEEVLRKNMIKIRVFPHAVTGNEHREVPSYHFAEALSEIGGIFGLWVGMSLLTFFEFIELFVLMVAASVRTFIKYPKHRDVRQRRAIDYYNGIDYQAGCTNTEDNPIPTSGNLPVWC